MMMRVLAVLSLLVCLTAGLLFFWGQTSDAGYKGILAIASLAWFVFATLSIRRKPGAP